MDRPYILAEDSSGAQDPTLSLRGERLPLPALYPLTPFLANNQFVFTWGSLLGSRFFSETCVLQSVFVMKGFSCRPNHLDDVCLV